MENVIAEWAMVVAFILLIISIGWYMKCQTEWPPDFRWPKRFFTLAAVIAFFSLLVLLG